MPNLDLSFASGESSLTVRSFSIDQRMSGLFEVSVVAVSPDDDLDLDALLGSGAALRLGSADAGASFRAWTGIVSHAEQVDIDAAHEATYYLRIVPALWRTTRRRNNRIFQHRSIPEIATSLLAEWGIEPIVELDLASFPRFEYRVQYGETDFAFLSRILEEAGIAYAFRDPDPAEEAAQTALVLGTDAHAGALREGGPLIYVPGKDVQHPPSSIWQVRFIEDVRAGRRTLRDYDFRSRPDFQLFAEARAQVSIEDRFELYDYAPGAFLVEPEGGRGARVDERHAQALAARQLGAERQGKRSVSFRANVLDLAPGVVFAIAGHPRRELGDARRLLAVRQIIEGARDGEWNITGHAVLADEPYRPALVTPRPRIHGVQSALVVGPAGEEIHTDELGRVRVQFHWDREGKRDQNSSCFVRVSQAWAGRGFGVEAIPRVGDEVLVGFFEGDPDQPVVVGRVHNSAARVPLALPAQKTRTTWRTESTPGGGGWNEITFEDQKGKELVYVQAERDLERLVKQHETVTIGASLETSIGTTETRAIGADQTVRIGGSRTSEVKGSETLAVGESFRLDLGGGAAGAAITRDKRIVFTTGEASIVLDGPNIYFDAQAAVHLKGGDVVAIAGAEVHVDGGPNVYLNAGSAGAPVPLALDTAIDLEAHLDLPETPIEQAFSALLSVPPEEPGAAPEAIPLPAHVEEQLRAQRDKIAHGIEEIEAKVLEKVELVKAKIKALGENIVPRVEKARAEINARIEALRGQIEKIKAEAAARIAALKAEAERIRAAIQARIDKAKEIVARAKEAVDKVVERIEEAKTRVRETIADIKKRITDLRDDVKARFDELKKRAIAVRDQAQHVIDEVKGAIEHAKEQAKQLVTDVKTGIERAKQHFHDIVADLKNDNVSLKQRLKDAFGDFQELTADAKADAAKVSAGAKAIVNDAKANAAQIKADAKQTVDEAKALAQQAKQDVKDSIAEAKQAAKDSADQVKATADELKQQAKGAAADVKDAYGDIKGQVKDIFSTDPTKTAANALEQGADAGKAPVPFANKIPAGGSAPSLPLGGGGNTPSVSIPGFSSGGSSASSISIPSSLGGNGGAPVPFSNTIAAGGSSLGGGAPVPFSSTVAGGAPSLPAAPQSTIVTRSGAFGADTVARSVNGTNGATFLQSPNEGQLMIVPTQGARPVAANLLSAQVVEHQMSGMPSSDAFAAVLKEHGYLVYERPWDSLSGEFIQKAVL
ncbi:Rhs element Vgr protein [Minicystis rosea]|nr:Rhs element Vgr protein [Minicystis rosea]